MDHSYNLSPILIRIFTENLIFTYPREVRPRLYSFILFFYIRLSLVLFFKFSFLLILPSLFYFVYISNILYDQYKGKISCFR